MESVLNKDAGLKACNVIKKDSNTSAVNIANLKNSCFYRTPLVTASELFRTLLQGFIFTNQIFSNFFQWPIFTNFDKTDKVPEN